MPTYDELLMPQNVLPTDVAGGARTITDSQLRQVERESPAGPSIGTGIGAASRLTSTGIAAYVIAEEAGFEPDPDDVFPAADSPEFKALTDGLPVELWPNLARGVSAQHRQFIRENALQELAAAQDLSEMGVTGTALLMGRAVLDEGALALTVATGGLAAPFIYGAKATRLSRFAKLGTLTAAENTALDAILLKSQETKDPSDLLYSMIGGFALGGTVGALTKGEQRQLGKAMEAAAHANDLKALNDAGITSVGRPAGTPLANTIRAAHGERAVQNIEPYTASEPPRAVETDRSVGAAQASNVVHPLLDEQISPDILNVPRLGKQELSSIAARVGQKAESALRIDFAANFARSENPYVRFLGGLVADPVGYRGRVNEFSAEEISAGIRVASQTAFYRPVASAVPEWLAKNKVPLGQRTVAEAKFFEAVTDAVERQDFSDPHIGQVARGFSEAIRSAAEPAQRHGVKGFKELELRPDYVPHLPSHEKVPLLNTKYGDEQMEQLIAEAFRRATGASADTVARIAKGYWKRLRNLAAGLESAPQFAFRDEQLLRDSMRDAGIPDKQIDDALGEIDFGKDTTKEGKIPRAKRRLELDMETTVGLKNRETGNIDQVPIKVIFERDARLLVHNYTRQVSGHVAMAKRFGITSKADWDATLRKATAYASNNLSPKYVADKLAQDLSRLEFAYKNVTGQPVEDWTNWHRTARAIRDVNFMSDLGQSGFAQAGDIGNLVTLGGGRIVFEQIPELKAMATRIKTGQLSDAAADELEAMTGLGTDMLRHQAPSRFDLGYGDSLEPTLTGATGAKVDMALKAGRNFTATWSGLAPLTVIQQRAAAKAMQQQFVNTAFAADGAKLSHRNLLAMGIKDDMAPRIYAELRAHTEFQVGDSGRRVRKTNLDAWTDLDARDDYLLAIRREARRMILEGDLGSAPQLMSKEAGKVLFQFRGFAIHAYSKLLMRGLKIDGMRAFGPWASTMVFASVAYMLKQQANSVGLKDRKKFLEERLSTDRIIQAAFTNSAYSSLIPMGIDTLWQLGGQEPVFKGARTSGLESGFSWNSNPTTSTLYNLARTPGAFADGTVTKSELKGMISPYPLQNALVIKNVIDAIAEDMPTRAPRD